MVPLKASLSRSATSQDRMVGVAIAERAIGERPNGARRVSRQVTSPSAARASGVSVSGERRHPARNDLLGRLAVLALFGLSQDVVSRLDLLEALGGFVVARIGVGVRFLDQPTVRSLHCGEVCVAVELERV